MKQPQDTRPHTTPFKPVYIDGVIPPSRYVRRGTGEPKKTPRPVMDIVPRARLASTTGDIDEHTYTSDTHHGYARSASWLVITLIFLCASWVGLSHVGGTVSYFSDTEYSQGNVFESSLLDLLVDSDDTDPIGLACGAEHTFDVLTSTEAHGLDAQYRVHIEHAGGEACNAFMLSVKHGGDPVFSGLPFDFPGILTDEFGPWEFSFSLPKDATDIPNGEACTIDVVFSAWRKDSVLFADSGYTDRERVQFSVQVENASGAGTTTVVNKNSATVVNKTTASSNTGGNTSNVAGNTASSSGTIITGDATSTASTTNIVNTNITDTDSSACSSCEGVQTEGIGTTTDQKTTASSSKLRHLPDRGDTFDRSRSSSRDFTSGTTDIATTTGTTTTTTSTTTPDE